MAVLKQPYTGIRGMRYQFMLDNLPEKVAELKASGETESYLEQIETAYRNRISELTPGCMKSCGATTELRSSDLPSFPMGRRRQRAFPNGKRRPGYREVND